MKKTCTYSLCDNVTSNAKFCSRSCAASHNNKKFPKRKTVRKCLECNNVVKSYRHVRCDEHHTSHIKHLQDNKYQNKTLGYYKNLLSVKGKHPSWINSHVRGFNTSWNKKLKDLPCACCAYTKHVELCHIIPITEFSDDSTLGEINHIDNVVQLCRNCHWEMDNGLLQLIPLTGSLRFKFIQD